MGVVPVREFSAIACAPILELQGVLPTGYLLLGCLSHTSGGLPDG